MYKNDDGVGHTLSPTHLMYGRRITSLPNHSHFEIISTFQILTRQMKNHNRLLEQFTKRWREDYLVNLREVHSQKKKDNLLVISQWKMLVVLKDDFTKRMFWKLAVVEEPLMGRDGQVRPAIVKVINSKGTVSKYKIFNTYRNQS